MAKNPSPFVSTTVPYKASPVVGIKPVKPFIWQALPKPPKADPTALTPRGPAGSRARSTGKC